MRLKQSIFFYFCVKLASFAGKGCAQHEITFKTHRMIGWRLIRQVTQSAFEAQLANRLCLPPKFHAFLRENGIGIDTRLPDYMVTWQHD